VSERRGGALRAAAVGAEDLGAVGEEAATDERLDAAVADEALAVPVTLVERDELRPAQSCVADTAPNTT